MRTRAPQSLAAVSMVDDGHIRALAVQDIDLLESFLQGVAIAGVANKAAHADNKTIVQGGDDYTNLAIELMGTLALGAPIHVLDNQGLLPPAQDSAIR